jgi:hypothetical protein
VLTCAAWNIRGAADLIHRVALALGDGAVGIIIGAFVEAGTGTSSGSSTAGGIAFVPLSPGGPHVFLCKYDAGYMCL